MNINQIGEDNPTWHIPVLHLKCHIFLQESQQFLEANKSAGHTKGFVIHMSDRPHELQQSCASV